MGKLDSIFVVPEDFIATLEKFNALTDEFESEYKKIISSNSNLAAAWEGESGAKFREQASKVEEIFSKNVESLKIILQSRLQYALDNIVEQDLIIANLINGDPLAKRMNSNIYGKYSVFNGEVKKNEEQFVQGH